MIPLLRCGQELCLNRAGETGTWWIRWQL